MGVIRTILDILFPVHCIGCRTQDEFICLDCISKFPPAAPNTPSGVTALFSYQHPLVKRSLWMLKYHHKKGLSENLGRALHAAIILEYTDLLQFQNFHNPLLIPAPLSKKRKRQRGFNQSEVLAKNIQSADHDHIFHVETSAVEKIIHTKNQADIHDRRTRLHNLSGVFKVTHPEKITGRNIILIDDVTTTGATLAELKKVLKEAGAKKVIAFTVAH